MTAIPYHGNPNFLQMPVPVAPYQSALTKAMDASLIPVVCGLEIGLGWGASAQAFLERFTEAKLFSMDVNDWLPARKELEKKYPHRFKFLSPFDASMWADDVVQWLYIDGGHEYADLVLDIASYLPKLKSGGILCFDDYNNDECPGVKFAVDEFIRNQTAASLALKETPSPLIESGGPTGVVYWRKP